MFKGLVCSRFLRAVSASFSGIISVLVNLVCMLGCLFLFLSPDQYAIVLAIIVLLHIVVVGILVAADLVVGVVREDIPLYEIDKFFAGILIGYIMGAFFSFIVFKDKIFTL
jgi:hypothetical protein